MSMTSSSSLASQSPTSTEESLRRAWRKGATPPPRIGIPDWADRERHHGSGAGSTSGRWRTSRVEIARGPMLAATEPGVHVLTCMVATQLLKTSVLENIFGFHAHLDPCPILVVQPKEDAAEAFSKERIQPMIAATPALREIVGSSKTRKSESTLTYKAFPGGFLALVGAGSPDNLARRPVRIVLYDEIDKYQITKEGDPLDLGDERMASFPNWLSVRVCSPTIEDESAIEASYLASDQRRASIACPHCGHRQFPAFFDHVEWPEGKPRQALIHCEACGEAWSEGERLRALATIRWHQTRPFECCDARHEPLTAYRQAWSVDGLVDAVEAVWDWWESPRWAVYRAKCPTCGDWCVPNEHAGFQAGKLYSPWPKDTPAAQAVKYLAAKDSEDKKQVWFNTQQGVPYKRNTAKSLKDDELARRGEVWAAEVPDGVAVVVIGVDVQDYRLEAEVVGYGANEESWSIAYEVIDGQMDEPGTQAALDAFLQRTWSRADGRAFKAEAVCIDSGGHHTQAVYAFAKDRLGRKVWAIKGESVGAGGQRNPVWPVKRPSSRSKKAFRPVILGVNAAKDSVRDRLLKTIADPEVTSGPGYMHFPADRDLNWYAQLTAERLTIKVAKGRKFRVWEQIPGRANEALDCRVYAYGALCGLMHMGLKLNRRAEEVRAAPRPPVRGETPSRPVAPVAASPNPAPTPTSRTPADRVELARRLAARLTRK